MSEVEKRAFGTEGDYLLVIPALQDNYIYLLVSHCQAIAIDPGDATPVLACLEKNQLKLKNILITHYHHDHTGGCEELKKQTQCSIIGPEDNRIPYLDRSVADGEELIIGSFVIEVFNADGHTKPHLIYFLRDAGLLFTGDLLFGAGCGRLFEATPEEMWHSLQKVMELPDETLIFCAHEYTCSNLKFALSIEPNNALVKSRLTRSASLIEQGKSTMPSTLAEEKQTNPFLRAQDPVLKKQLNMESASDVEVFAQLRLNKDHFF